MGGFSRRKKNKEKVGTYAHVCFKGCKIFCNYGSDIYGGSGYISFYANTKAVLLDRI